MVLSGVLGDNTELPVTICDAIFYLRVHLLETNHAQNKTVLFLVALCSGILCHLLCAVLSRARLSATPGTEVHQAPLVHGDSPGKDTEAGCHALLQGPLTIT